MPGFSVKEDSKLGKAIKKRGKKAVTDLLLGGGFYLKGFKPEITKWGSNLTNKLANKSFTRSDLGSGLAGTGRTGKGSTGGGIFGFDKATGKVIDKIDELLTSGTAKDTKKLIGKPKNRKN
tara:strand:+ start:348 stop:710 length:363 start_codon:yes stop_codon:yes gene_type:complete